MDDAQTAVAVVSEDEHVVTESAWS
jgi:hypothetical protein